MEKAATTIDLIESAQKRFLRGTYAGKRFFCVRVSRKDLT
jgi:hypothetical protein